MSEQAHMAAETYMLREIREQPAVLRNALAGAVEPARRVATEMARRDVDVIILAARGTSDHAALYAQYLFQYLNGIPVALATPSLHTLYGATLRLGRALVIGISQSGESPDVVEVVDRARAAGAFTVGITNQEGSLLATTAHEILFCHAGPERSVAATKTYTTTCAALAMLAAALPGGEPLRGHMEWIPELVAAALQSEAILARVAERYTHARDCVVLGRVFQYSTARETALKLEETCYVVATPFSTADFRHGPAALVERGLPVIIFAPPGRTASDALDLLQWLRERDADCLVIAEEERLLDLATIPVQLTLPALTDLVVRGPTPETATTVAELLAPLPYIIPGQLLAHYLAHAKGLNPDQPRSLMKVTRTR
jgi:glucosamine--fructose-6-phosphate aminotransferase (isomerizing)